MDVVSPEFVAPDIDVPYLEVGLLYVLLTCTLHSGISPFIIEC